MRWTAPLTLLLLGACSLPRWPVEGTISSPFGLRLDGIWPEVHRGVDIPLDVGTPVQAMGPGRVIESGWLRGYGLAIVLDHGRGVYSIYAHLSEASVRKGEEVGGGHVIGRSGATGDVTGPHLHFEVWRGGRPEDPVAFLGRPPATGR